MVATSNNEAENREESRLIIDVSGRRNDVPYGTTESNTDSQLQCSPEIEPPTEAKVSWSSLPHKRQLAVLVIARLSEPLVQTSLQVRWVLHQHMSLGIPDLLEWY